MQPLAPYISVVVCTYNRLKLLETCLESLAHQLGTLSSFEVLVVDNGSDDGTIAYLERIVRNNIHFRWVSEPVLGLSHARNRGLREAVGVYVAFIDDDAIAEPDWVEQIAAFAESNPEIVVFGGPYEAYVVNQLPAWFPPEYGSWKLAGGPRPIIFGTEWLCGTNMVFKKELLSSVGGFDIRYGMTGAEVAYGEETELFSKIVKMGIPLYYVPSLKVRHLIPDYKMSLDWLLKSAYKRGVVDGRLVGSKYPVLVDIACIFLSLGKSLLTLLRTGPMPLKRKLYFSLAPLFAETGRVLARMTH